jgi:hypothetical protein
LICADDVIRYFRAANAPVETIESSRTHAARIMMLRFKILPL